MSAFEEFSKEIDLMSKAHKVSRIARFICRCEYLYRRYWSNEPLPFGWVDDKVGEKAGDPIEIVHLTMYDMMEHQARGILTRKVLLDGLRINAFQTLKFERLDDWNGKTTIQPQWV